MWGKEGGVFRNNYKGHMDKSKSGWNQEGEVGMDGVGGRGMGERQKLYLNNNKIKNEISMEPPE